MTSKLIVPRRKPFVAGHLRVPWPFVTTRAGRPQPNLHHLAQLPDAQLPRFVRESTVALRYLRLLGPLAWDRFPERDLDTPWHIPALPYAPLVGAYLVKLDQHHTYMSQLRQYLVAHPALTWVLGFPLVPSRHYPWGFDVDASLPTHRHFTRILRRLPNTSLQFLLDDTVRLLQVALATVVPDFGQTISLDTKHIIAWVKENNPKAYVKDRYVKEQQPAGDPDCRLGCKRKHNQRTGPATPTTDAVPANTVAVGEYYWGYGSGVVATKVPDWGEVVLAELTQTFDHGDVSYFFPLMTDVERRLGFRPQFGALDAAFDAFYIYEYFAHDPQDWTAGFAAIPFSQKGGYRRSFSPAGLPLCEAQLPMPCKLTFTSRTRCIIVHEEARYACPLLFPQPTGRTCPINHSRWAKGGCVTTMPTSIGTRLRYQLDRDSEQYHQVYQQRTATERINAQAVALGIERPKLRNAQAITNLNTLIYVLINLRTLQRVREKQAAQD